MASAKILFVDDSRTFRLMFAKSLADIGYKDPVICSSAEEAKQILESQKIDIVLSDWHMVGESGLDLLRWVRKHPRLSATPFVMVTSERKGQYALEGEVDGYLMKPVDKGLLKAKLQELISGRLLGNDGQKNGDPKPANPDSNQAIMAGVTWLEYGVEYLMSPGGGRYPLILGNEMAGMFAERVAQHFPKARFQLVTDHEVEKVQAETIRTWEGTLKYDKHRVLAGKENCNLEAYGEVVGGLHEKRSDRSTVILAMGGSAVCRLGGFVASTFSGGIPFVIIPTTWRAVMDTTVSGAVGIHHHGRSDLIASRYDPSLAWCDLAFLKTLSQPDYRMGLAELYRHALFAGVDVFCLLEMMGEEIREQSLESIREGVMQCLISRAVLTHNARAHDASTSFSDFPGQVADALARQLPGSDCPHGSILFKGIECAVELGFKCGCIPSKSAEPMASFLRKVPKQTLPGEVNSSRLYADLLAAIPNRDQKIRVMVPTLPGTSEIRDGISTNDLMEVLRKVFV